jgi:hypothetical protein
MAQIYGIVDQRTFVRAGNSIFTLHNPRTGGRYTYKVVRPGNKPVLYVNLLARPDNHKDFVRLGIIFEEPDFQLGRPAHRFVVPSRWKISTRATSARAFAWVWSNLRRGKPIFPAEFFHEGRCGKCGRRLTVPESIQSGLGPVCAGRVMAA